jgi:hypothetical protein
VENDSVMRQKSLTSFLHLQSQISLETIRNLIILLSTSVVLYIIVCNINTTTITTLYLDEKDKMPEKNRHKVEKVGNTKALEVTSLKRLLKANA